MHRPYAPRPGPPGALLLAVVGIFVAALWLLGSRGSQEEASTTSDPPATTQPIVSTTQHVSTTAPTSEMEIDSLEPEESENPWMQTDGELGDLMPTPTPPWGDANGVRAVAAAPDGGLWATTAVGVVRWSPAGEDFTLFRTDEDLPVGDPEAIAIDTGGRVWVVIGGTLVSWDDDLWVGVPIPESMPQSTYPGSPLAAAPDGTVWALHSSSLMNCTADGCVTYGVSPFNSLGPWSGSMAVGTDGTVWAGTASTDPNHDGVAAFDGDTWTQYLEVDGLPREVGGSIAVAADGTVWAGSMGDREDREAGGGVSSFDGSTWTNYTTADGLITNNTDVVAGPDGSVWAVAPEGLARFEDSRWIGYPDVTGFGFGGVVDADGVLWAPAVHPATGILGFDGMETRNLFAPTPLDAVDADAGSSRLPLGERDELPDNARLDFLAGNCVFGSCYRDAHFADPLSDHLGSGTWVANVPFHIRHGFVNESPDPLGDGFDVVVYVTRRSGAELPGNAYELDRTHRFATDYVMRAVTSKCGPGYWDQGEPQTCEWFVHDFPHGLPPGRYDIWVEWYAPCSAWLDLGLADSCTDPDAVSSRFASEVNMPFDDPPAQPVYEWITRGAESG